MAYDSKNNYDRNIDNAPCYKNAVIGYTPSCHQANALCLRPRCELISSIGGAAQVGHELHEANPGKSVAIMVAANSGRPAGALGDRGQLAREKLHAGHKTQEEDVCSGWLIAEEADITKRDQLYRDTINQRWGMREVSSVDTDTIQGVNYMDATTADAYGDAWVVRRAVLCAKTLQNSAQGKKLMFDTTQRYRCTLVFIGGPNAGGRRRKQGSMARTWNQRSSENYPFFRECIKAALRTGLDSMLHESIDFALVARISCGVYAGKHRRRINTEFEHIVNELLVEKVPTTGVARGRYFARVVVPDTLKTTVQRTEKEHNQKRMRTIPTQNLEKRQKM